MTNSPAYARHYQRRRRHNRTMFYRLLCAVTGSGNPYRGVVESSDGQIHFYRPIGRIMSARQSQPLLQEQGHEQNEETGTNPQ